MDLPSYFLREASASLFFYLNFLLICWKKWYNKVL